MIAKLKPYREYKDSGVPWLAMVPAGWQVRRLKRIATINPSKSECRQLLATDAPAVFLPMERVGTDGRIDTREVGRAPALYNGFTYFRRSDVLMAKITPCFENGKGACLDGLPTEIGFGSTEFYVLRAAPDVLPQFLYRLTTLPDLRQLGTDAMTGAAGQQRVPHTFIANFEVPVPDPSEQRAIIRFLDHADRRIRRYVAAKKKMIALLNEQKQAIITRAVTRGLDPTIHLKASRLQWFGDVPEQWQVTTLRRVLIARIRNGLYKGREYYKDDGTPIVQMGEAFACPELENPAQDRVLLSQLERTTWGLERGDLLAIG